ncbi:hypothetical protein [Streptomyces sp. NPDC005533]|uniref:hypothetical protein n=1 Tax=Streptomyces sp. NPDC005533 TaxID=3364723 RepID=UPI0036A34A28
MSRRPLADAKSAKKGARNRVAAPRWPRRSGRAGRTRARGGVRGGGLGGEATGGSLAVRSADCGIRGPGPGPGCRGLGPGSAGRIP